MNSRADIKAFILKIEKEFSVNDWKINGVHVWPILRIRFYFHLVNQMESLNESSVMQKHAIEAFSSRSFCKKVLIRIQKKAKKIRSVFFYYSWLFNLSQKRYLFLGTDAHRINYKNKRYNRYFDVFIEQYEILNQSIVIEYDKVSHDKHQYKEIIKHYHKALSGFIEKKKMFAKSQNDEINLQGYDLFLRFLEDNDQTKGFTKLNSEENLIRNLEKDFFPRIMFFKQVLKRIQPERVSVLCYYNEDMMALMAAANQLEIETVDMQHGPQADVHLAYGSWGNVPQEGYDLLPRNFWCWDESSKQVLDTWISKTSLYHSRVVGNPWVDYWKRIKEDYAQSDYILYSLQPSPLTIEQLFPQVLSDFIKNYPYKWFIRIHPRQLENLEEIVVFLKEKKVYELVNLHDATNDALPQLLSNAKIHITNFSGTTIEAGLFDVFTVLINDIGIICFNYLISKNQAMYLDINSPDFTHHLINAIEDQANRPRINTFASDRENQNLFE